MVMASHSKTEIVSVVKAAFDNQQLPELENGCYGVHNVEVGISIRRRGSQRTTSDLLYRAH